MARRKHTPEHMINKLRQAEEASVEPSWFYQLIVSRSVSISSLVRLAYCHDRSPSLGTRVETSVLS